MCSSEDVAVARVGEEDERVGRRCGGFVFQGERRGVAMEEGIKRALQRPAPCVRSRLWWRLWSGAL